MMAIRLGRERSLSGPAGWLLALGYVLAFLALDWASYIRPLESLNITPWNPQPALAVALLIWSRRAIWLVWLGLMCAELVVRGLPADWLPVLAAYAALSFAYAAIARALSQKIDLQHPLATRANLGWFTLIVTAGSLLSALVFVLSFAAAGQTPGHSVYAAITRYWIGDAVGFVVTLPILLLAMNPRGRVALVSAARNRTWLASAALTCLCVWVVFGRGELDYFKYFYLLLLPVIWSSVSIGVAGAVLSSMLTQLGLIAAIHLTSHPDLTVFQLQALMAASASTALLLGVLVDERSRAAAELQTSLRFAAAGQMAAALAHELSQPLTALRNYVQAARTLAQIPQPATAQQQEQLLDVMQRVANEAQRAGEAVRRLRDFFKSGTAHLQLAPLGAAINEVIESHLDFAARMNVRLDAQIAGGLPQVRMDTLQVGVLLRNLLTNAIESAAAGAQAGRVVVRATRDGPNLRVEINDSGPGIDAARIQTLFDAAPSGKSGGMGVGLNICRAIVTAHGGTLWAQPGPGGRLFFTLPIDA
jgi:signal transduction histidine kinase